MKFDIEDMRQFADRHRGKNVMSGPHWSTIIRFPMLFDEYERLLKVNTEQQYRLNAEISELRTQLETQRKFVERLSVWIDKAVEIHPDLYPALGDSRK